MPVHIHRLRQWTGWTLGAVAILPWSLCLDLPVSSFHPAVVTGRVTCSGRPLGDVTVCLDRDGQHSAYATLRADGSFRLVNMTLALDGALPGRYHAHLYTHAQGPLLPSKYRDPATSELVLDVGPGWNDFRIDLEPSPDDLRR